MCEPSAMDSRRSEFRASNNLITEFLEKMLHGTLHSSHKVH